MDIFWIFVAFVSGTLSRLIGLPSIVGFLSAGMLLSGFGVESGPVLEELGTIGVALLLFTVGLELNPKSIWRMEVLAVGGLHTLLATLVATVGALIVGLSVVSAVVLGIALAVSSIILAARTLEERDELTSYHGRVAIGILLLQTILIGIVLVLVGGSRPSPWALGLVGLIALRPALSWFLSHLDSRELVLMFGLLLAMGGSFVFRSLGLPGEIGALAAGALLAGSVDVERVSDKLWSLKEIFLAAFFLRVGLSGYPEGSDVIIVLALVGFLLFKGGLYFGLLALFRLKARTAFMTSVALTSFSGITLIIGVIAVDAGLLPQRMISVLTAATAISYALNAVATRFSLQIWRRVASWLSIAEREGKHRESLPRTLGNSRYLIIGMGRAGTAAYNRLAELGHSVTGMDYDPNKLAEQRALQHRVVYGDGTDKALWQQLDLDKIKAIVLGVPGPRSKIDVAKSLRDSGYEGTISALTADTVERAALIEAGATAVHLARDQAGKALAEHVLSLDAATSQPGEYGLAISLDPAT